MLLEEHVRATVTEGFQFLLFFLLLNRSPLFDYSENEDSPESSSFHGNIYEGDDDLVIDLQE